jgi:hypothetical protein
LAVLKFSSSKRPDVFLQRIETGGVSDTGEVSMIGAEIERSPWGSSHTLYPDALRNHPSVKDAEYLV